MLLDTSDSLLDCFLSGVVSDAVEIHNSVSDSLGHFLTVGVQGYPLGTVIGMNEFTLYKNSSTIGVSDHIKVGLLVDVSVAVIASSSLVGEQEVIVSLDLVGQFIGVILPSSGE